MSVGQYEKTFVQQLSPVRGTRRKNYQSLFSQTAPEGLSSGGCGPAFIDYVDIVSFVCTFLSAQPASRVSLRAELPVENHKCFSLRRKFATSKVLRDAVLA